MKKIISLLATLLLATTAFSNGTSANGGEKQSGIGTSICSTGGLLQYKGKIYQYEYLEERSEAYSLESFNFGEKIRNTYNYVSDYDNFKNVGLSNICHTLLVELLLKYLI